VVLVAHRHRVDRELIALGSDHPDHLEQVARRVGADEQPAVRVFTGVFDCEACLPVGACYA
jgi:hypothetical protein